MKSRKKPKPEKPFDVTLKHLAEKAPRGCVEYAGLVATGPVRLIDADLATITSAADKVFHIGGLHPWLAHLEFQASYEKLLGRRLLRYNVLLVGRHDLPVATVVILLRPEADGPGITGLEELGRLGKKPYLRFDYSVVRAWEQPVEKVLKGDLAMLPLAPISQVSAEQLPGVIQEMEKRLSQEATPAERNDMWAATLILMGLRFPLDTAAKLLKGVHGMKESVTYQAILEEGEAKGRAEGEAKGKLEEAKHLLLLQGRAHLGAPDAKTRAALEKIENLHALEQLFAKLLKTSSWAELLASTKVNGGRHKS